MTFPTFALIVTIIGLMMVAPPWAGPEAFTVWSVGVVLAFVVHAMVIRLPRKDAP